MEFLVLLIHAAFLISLVRRLRWFTSTEIHPRVLSLILVVKMAAGLSAGYIYLMLYKGGDTYSFFHSGVFLKQLLTSHPADFLQLMRGDYTIPDFQQKFAPLTTWLNTDFIFNDNRTVVIIHMLLAFISGEYYSVHALWFAFFSMAGLTGFYRWASGSVQIKNQWMILALFGAPSAIFWLSAAGKESLVVCFTGMVVGLWQQRLLGTQTLLQSVLMLCFLALSFLIKPYIILLLAPAMAAWYIAYRYPHYKTWLSYLSVYSVLLLSAMALSLAGPSWDISHLIYVKRISFEGFAAAFPDSFKTHIQLPVFSDNWLSLLLHTPAACAACLIQPFRFLTHQPALLLLSIENLVYLLITAFTLFQFRKEKIRARQNMFWFCLCFSFSLMTLIGLTTPVAGAIVRYKAIALPFLLIMAALAFTHRTESRPRSAA